MKLVRWEFQGLHVPMMEDDQGNLFCTSKQLADALQVEERTVRQIKSRNTEEFEALGEQPVPLAFFSDHRVEFGLKRIKKDMVVWSEDQMIMVAVLVKSPTGREFRKNLVQFIKQHARKGYVHESICEELKQEIADIKEYLNMTASVSGKLLNAQKQTKHLRVLN